VKNKRIDSDIIAKATNMKIIMQYGVGLEGEYKRGVVVQVLMCYLTFLITFPQN
jgi:hypothetical protein